MNALDDYFRTDDHLRAQITELALLCGKFNERIRELEIWRDEHSNLEQHLEPGV
jgi:hypothetical protein